MDVHTQLLQAVQSYQPPRQAVELLKQHPPLVVAGVTAAGKNTVADYIVGHSNYRRVITHTTRSVREAEAHGVDRWFVSEEEMLELVKAGKFIETKAIHGETVYGTSVMAYERAVADNHRPLTDTDVQGIEEFAKYVPDIKAYFLIPPDYVEWMRRLHGRGIIEDAEKARRLESARKEIAAALAEPRFEIVVNHQVADTARLILDSAVNAQLQAAGRDLAQQLLAHLNQNA